MNELFLFGLIGFGVLTVLFGWGTVRAFRGRRWVGTVGRTGGGALCLALAALSATLGVSTQGYRALIAEEVAATVTTVPAEPQSFQAHVEFPDGRDTTFLVSGDQLLVDAHILKWHSVGHVLGLRTQYELDRITGRYAAIEDEREAPRTVHSLNADKPVDLFHLARRYALLAFLVDAEYGSASFVDVERPARFQVRVSTTGLLIREIPLSGGASGA